MNLTVFFKLLGSASVKAVRRTLMKLSPCLNFINILCKAYTHADPKSTNNTVKWSVFFALFGSVCVKAALITLMKLTPSVNFTNIIMYSQLCTHRSQNCKYTVNLLVYFHTFGICTCKSCMKNVSDIDPRCKLHQVLKVALKPEDLH